MVQVYSSIVSRLSKVAFSDLHAVFGIIPAGGFLDEAVASCFNSGFAVDFQKKILNFCKSQIKAWSI